MSGKPIRSRPTRLTFRFWAENLPPTMKNVLMSGLLCAGFCLMTASSSFATSSGVPEIDPASASGGLALAFASVAVLAERRRRR